MNKVSSIEATGRTNLTDQTKFRLNEISKIENYFNQEITERMLNIKKLSKYVAAFVYMDIILIVFSATSGGVSIIFYNCYWSSCRNSKCKFYINFFFTRSKNKIHYEILFLLRVN